MGGRLLMSQSCGNSGPAGIREIIGSDAGESLDNF